MAQNQTGEQAEEIRSGVMLRVVATIAIAVAAACVAVFAAGTF